jgi:hypothetical protein
MSQFLADTGFLAAGLAGIAGAVMLLARSWRLRVAGLALQYIAVFWLVAISWPLGLASIKLVVGWLAGAILGISRIDFLARQERRWPTEWLFFGLVVLLVVAAVFSLAPGMLTWFPGSTPAQIWGGLLLIGMGLVHLGIASRGLRVVVSLLTILSGFEILYAIIERSTLVAGLLAAVTLGVALVGAYLLGSTPEELQP